MTDGQILQFTFTEDEKGRLDKFLVRCLPDHSRARLQGLIKDGLVTVDGKPVTKAGFDLEAGSQVQVEIPAPQPTDLVAEDIPLKIIFENEDLMVIDKPAGMVVHPAAGHASGTLVNATLAHDPDMEGVAGEGRPGIVHRLDKDTSGLIVVAKNDNALYWLQEQFRLRKVRKIYLALSDGHPKTPTGRIEAAIGRDPSSRKQMAIVPEDKGRAAASEYQVLQSFSQHSLFEVHPETGRTHQIRLHLALIDCPIVGDTLYGRKHPTLPLARQFLHAARLTITLPGETAPRTFVSELPEDLDVVLKQLINNQSLGKGIR
jgi:23S rRNA pseudouridine1911/1915/1917 synthase